MLLRTGICKTCSDSTYDCCGSTTTCCGCPNTTAKEMADAIDELAVYDDSSLDYDDEQADFSAMIAGMDEPTEIVRVAELDAAVQRWLQDREALAAMAIG